MKFTIRDGDYIDYEAAKKDYVNGLIGEKLQKKYGISSKAYGTLLKDFEADGVKTNRRPKQKIYKKPTYVYYDKRTKYYKVERTRRGVRDYQGCFKNKKDAEQKVRELGWLE